MQFLVFVAFAIVLSVPVSGPPWETLHSPLLTGLIVIGQVVFAAGYGAVLSVLVKRRLEREPAWLQGAQNRLSRGSSLLRMLLVFNFAISVYLTDWTRFVRSVEWIRWVVGLDEVIILLPFLIAVVTAWAAVFPADRAIRRVSLEYRLWSSYPARPVWNLRGYLGFMLRHHVLIILMPMVPIVMAIDLIGPDYYGPALRRWTGLLWADQAALLLVAGVIFLLAPVALRYVWHTTVLPAGELRTRLERLCGQVGLRYRQILIWQSDGMMVNAAVMGLIRPVRYILLSDGLLEMMDDRQIEAVFGHEAGHVKHHHITFYLLFAVVSMLIVGGVNELLLYFWRDFFVGSQVAQDYLQVVAMAMILVVWGFGFGPVSRRFEWQADLFGARSVTDSLETCDRPCHVHHTAEEPIPATARKTSPVCATAAELFGDALKRIAVLNGIPIEAHSWRHSSIGNRVRRLKRYGHDVALITQLERSVNRIKAVLLAGAIIGTLIAVWLYLPDGWLGGGYGQMMQTVGQ